MSCRLVWVSIFPAIVGLSSPAIADGPLRPVKPWVLDYAEAQCVASRDYGSPDRRVTLAFRPSPTGATYEVFVLRNLTGPMFAEELQGSVDFGRGALKSWLLHYRIGSKKQEAFQFRITAAQMAQARDAASVTLQIKKELAFSFSLESMAELLNGLDACTADLKRYWNMEGTSVASIAVPSKGDLRSIFRSDDYPWEAQVRWQQGTVQFLLLIDEAGKVAACHVLLPSNVPVIDAMGCVVIRERAKFKSALDNNGKPVRSTVVTPPIVWRLM